MWEDIGEHRRMQEKLKPPRAPRHTSAYLPTFNAGELMPQNTELPCTSWMLLVFRLIESLTRSWPLSMNSSLMTARFANHACWAVGGLVRFRLVIGSMPGGVRLRGSGQA